MQLTRYNTQEFLLKADMAVVSCVGQLSATITRAPKRGQTCKRLKKTNTTT